jgi:hypothetical protein
MYVRGATIKFFKVRQHPSGCISPRGEIHLNGRASSRSSSQDLQGTRPA